MPEVKLSQFASVVGGVHELPVYLLVTHQPGGELEFKFFDVLISQER